MKKLFLFIFVGIFLNILVFGQDNDEDGSKQGADKILKNEVGVHAGFTTGVGFSFRYWMSKYGVQITAIPIITEDETIISTGISVLYNLAERKNSRMFLYFGNHIYYNKYYYDYYNESYDEDLIYNIGFGGGFEIGKYPKINVQAGYAVYNLTNEIRALPTVELGLYFDIRKRKKK